MDEVTLETVELPAGDKAILFLALPSGLAIVFDPVTHCAQFIDVKGEPTRERQSLTMRSTGAPQRRRWRRFRPGPLRLNIENCENTRTLPGVWIAGPALEQLLFAAQTVPHGEAAATNQTFRDIYHADTLDVEQRLKITSLTFLFTDLKGSTELDQRVGDLVAYDLVRAHFRVLTEIVGAEAGAVVKTIGDAVMATFPTPDRAVAASLAHARGDARSLNKERSATTTFCSRSASTRDHASPSCERASGLLRSDRQHRLARPAPRLLAGDLCDGSRGRPSSDGRIAREGRVSPVAQLPNPSRRRR